MSQPFMPARIEGAALPFRDGRIFRAALRLFIIPILLLASLNASAAAQSLRELESRNGTTPAGYNSPSFERSRTAIQHYLALCADRKQELARQREQSQEDAKPTAVADVEEPELLPLPPVKKTPQSVTTSHVGTVQPAGTLVQRAVGNAVVPGDVPGATQPICCHETCVQPPSVSRCGCQASDGCCSSLCGCQPFSSPLWFRADLLLWAVQGQKTPPLVTESPFGTPPSQIGLLGSPSTVTTLGDDPLNNGLRVGARIQGGMWLDPYRRFGINGDFLFLGEDSEELNLAAGDRLFARPFFNSNPAVNANDAEVLGGDTAATHLNIASSSDIFSAAPTLRWNACCCEWLDECGRTKSQRLDLLAGYRYFQFDEALESTEQLAPVGGFFAPGTSYEFYDRFETENRFHGLELGFDYKKQCCQWQLGLSSRVAFGVMDSTCTINGSTRVVVPDVLEQTIPGGFLTAGSRLGTFNRKEFAVLPQAEVRVGYCVTRQLRLHLAYNFMFLPSVVRPGSLIPASIDSDAFITAAPNAVPISKSTAESAAWLQGINLGLSLNF